MKLKELLSQINEVHKKYNTSTPYICGGVARDKFMGRNDNISDLDITTGDKTINLLGQEFLNTFSKKYNVESKVGGDGHLSVSIGNFKVDFSSNFVLPNIESIVGNPISNIQKESYSRDFTCNSLLSDIYLSKIIDPTSKGIKDINSKIVDTILDPAIVFTNSKNRPIRSIYLAVKLDFNLSNRVIEYLSKYPFLVKESSFDTIKEKISYSLNKDRDKCIYLLEKTNMIKFLPQELFNE